MPEHNNGESGGIDLLLDSTLDSVDRAEAEVLAVAERLGFDEDAMHQLGMAIRESMVNAVVHGNRYNAHKKVRLAIKPSGDRVSVTITDQGAGFELNAVPNPLEQENLLRQSGRGILLIQAFVDEFRVKKVQPSGTEVTLVKYRGSGSSPES